MTEVGLGARDALAVPGAGRVLWAGREAAWLRLPGGVCGLAGRSAPPGPLWMRGTFPWESFRRGAPVAVDDLAGRAAGAAVWDGPLPGPGALDPGDGGPVALGALAGVRPSAVVPALLPASLPAAAAALAGRGPGLTPAGDDVLCGLLFALRARGGPAVQAALLVVLDGLPTTDLSVALLRWSARGQHIGPAHDLLAAAASGDAAAARAAVSRLEAFGSTSGTEFCHGLRLGLVAEDGFLQPATTTSTSDTARSVLDT